MKKASHYYARSIEKDNNPEVRTAYILILFKLVDNIYTYAQGKGLVKDSGWRQYLS